MKKLVISYSHTGNNAALAKTISEKSGADYSEISETGKRTVFTILLDSIFNRIPKTSLLQDAIEKYDYVIFVAPIWFGKIASPFREVFNRYRDHIKKYAFVSISGGADGMRPELEKELTKYMGKAPHALAHLLISDLLPVQDRGNHKILNDYKICEQEVSRLSEMALQML